MNEKELFLFFLVGVGWVITWFKVSPILLERLKAIYEKSSPWQFRWMDCAFLILSVYSFYEVIARKWIQGLSVLSLDFSSVILEIISYTLLFVSFVLFGAVLYVFFDIMMRMFSLLTIYFFISVVLIMLIPTGRWNGIFSFGHEVWNIYQFFLIVYLPIEIGRALRAGWYYITKTRPPIERIRFRSGSM
ncbi:hypothetical protein A3J56_02645 [Candidatus Giovannonibacteria bacterium RIFCSPHIGHO2_02_FULL_46_20]|uniref:Uncharacterized protein n=1 Tax=Candidatus Giovannonibacteria bacterium RIFCSPHIGHO2_02_FULL_46_20 TaxID=1798338 RepID=A0A1F5WF34_9BACT|nr:MAG: hypothetical protein A3J56_02645 [Candidatus Giovannonibacteria bacterium RIFCSPHIGHO2_02_FULL_46_20]